MTTERTRKARHILSLLVLFSLFTSGLAQQQQSPPDKLSKEAETRAQPTPETKIAARPKFALLVGIDKYQNVRRLHGSVKGALSMRDVTVHTAARKV